MLKGLLTRQIFMFVDLALAVLTVFVAYQVFTKLFQPPVSGVAPVEATVEAAVPTLPTVGSRDAYNTIVTSRLFGPAGEARKEAPVDVAPQTEVAESEFAAVLKLKGTSFTKVRPNALIERQGEGARVYQTGEEVIEGKVKLEEVHNRWVYLFNLDKKQREILRMDDEETALSQAEPPEVPFAASPKGPGDGTALKRDELQKELESMTENIADLVTTANPHPVQDANGNVVGFTADNLSSIPLAKRMGFKDGDVLKEINGMPVDSIESISAVIEKFQNAGDFRITVMRNGKSTLLKFKLE